MAKLIFIDKNFSGQVYELVLERTTVGRGEQNTLVIPDNSLSATHCEILVNASEVIVRDLNSRNGTFVNGVRLKNQQSELRQGQTVRFGSVEARLDLELVYDNGPASEPSGSYAHDRFIREQERRAQERPKPTNASKHLVSAAQPVVEEHTVLLPAEVLTVPAPTTTPLALPKVEPRTPTRSPSVIRALLERFFGKKAGVTHTEGQTPDVQPATHAPHPPANRGSAARRQMEEYVESELRQAVPSGWTWQPNCGRLWWTIRRVAIPPGEWPDQEYDVHVSEDLAWLIVTYDNCDVGCGSLCQEFQQARVISASSLKRYPLGSCIHFILEHCKPNEWGYT